MNPADALVIAAALALSAFLAWFFFGPKQARGAELRGGVQEVEVEVRGGYSPNHIRVRQGVPLRLVFNRQEGGDCTARVVFPDFGVSRSLPAFTRTTVELTPDRAGEFAFACGMNMVHGTLAVEPAEPGASAFPGTPEEAGTVGGSSAAEHTHEVARAVGVGPTITVGATERVELALVGDGVTCPTCVVGIEAAVSRLPGVDSVDANYGAERVTVAYDPAKVALPELEAAITRAGYRVRERPEPGSAETEDAEAAARRAEIADLTRRVVLGAVLSAPVAFAVMAHEAFHAAWIPEILLNR